MAGEISTVRMPNMKHLGRSMLIRNAALIVIATAGGFAFLRYRMIEKKNNYAEFFKTYDPKASYERMRKAGLMQAEKP